MITKPSNERMIKILQKILEEGHGGGNWRRLINQAIVKLKNNIEV